MPPMALYKNLISDKMKTLFEPESPIEQFATISYQFGSICGTEQVRCMSDEDDDDVIARAKRKLLRTKFGGYFPQGKQQFSIDKRQEIIPE